MTLPGFEGVADHNASQRPSDHYPTPAREAALLVEVLRQRVPTGRHRDLAYDREQHAASRRGRAAPCT